MGSRASILYVSSTLYFIQVDEPDWTLGWSVYFLFKVESRFVWPLCVNPIRPGGGVGEGEGGFWCPRQIWVARNLRQIRIILSYHRAFPQIYLAVWWCCSILVMGSDVAMATAIWRACLAEIWISCLFFTLNWIVMLGIKYFGHLEHYCFEKNDIFFRSICDVTDDVIQI